MAEKDEVRRIVPGDLQQLLVDGRNTRLGATEDRGRARDIAVGEIQHVVASPSQAIAQLE